MRRFILLGFAVLAAVATLAGTASARGAAAASGNGSTVLQATLPTGGFFDVNGVPTLYIFTCNENRVQRKDGSATESMNCQLDPGQTPPSKAAQFTPATPGTPYAAWASDFFLNSVPGFAGPIVTTDYHGVLTPSGVVNFSATYAAP
jgi:hypothetical protein